MSNNIESFDHPPEEPAPRQEGFLRYFKDAFRRMYRGIPNDFGDLPTPAVNEHITERRRILATKSDRFSSEPSRVIRAQLSMLDKNDIEVMQRDKTYAADDLLKDIETAGGGQPEPPRDNHSR